MKKALIIILGVSLVSCNSNSGNQSQTDSGNAAKKDTGRQVIKPPVDISNLNKKEQQTGKGAVLIASSDCMSCHKTEQKLVGPAFQAIASKYRGNTTAIDRLSDKIIKGGSGVWGEVAMNAHPSLAKAEAKAMVEYIFHITQ